MTTTDPALAIEKGYTRIALFTVGALTGVLLAPMIAYGATGQWASIKTRFWIVPRWWVPAVVVSLAVGLVLVARQVVALVVWAQALPPMTRDVLLEQVPTLASWWLVNAAVGVFIAPAFVSWKRRQIARLTASRQIPDVTRQDEIEVARARAAQYRTARAMGTRLNIQTGQIVGGSATMTAPHPVGERSAFGLVIRPTIRTVYERFRDVRNVRDWISDDRRYMLLPRSAGAIRAMVVAESGTGKTVLLFNLMLAALAQGCRVVFIDAKGAPKDAEELAGQVRGMSKTVTIASQWNLFTGTAAQITSKLMRLLPPPDGANQHYLAEAKLVLTAVQRSGTPDESPMRSLDDLRQRLTDPVPFVREADLALVGAIVDSKTGLTASQRVLQSLYAVLIDMEGLLSTDGWSYRTLEHDVTIVSLSPVDAAQLKAGDLMLDDLRHYMTSRLQARDTSPLVVVCDEFAQLVVPDGGGADAGDTAARMFETARSAGMGLVLAFQSAAGVSSTAESRERAFVSGAAIILGRSKNPEDIVKYAGTDIRQEASGSATGAMLGSARAQHVFRILPNAVRESWDGAFWIIQGGSSMQFAVLPPGAEAGQTPDMRPTPAATAAAPVAVPAPAVIEPAAVSTAPPQPADTVSAQVETQPDPAHDVAAVVVRMMEQTEGSWLAAAFPVNADGAVIGDDAPMGSLVTDERAPYVPTGTYEFTARLDGPNDWGGTKFFLPDEWIALCERLVEEVRDQHPGCDSR